MCSDIPDSWYWIFDEWNSTLPPTYSFSISGAHGKPIIQSEWPRHQFDYSAERKPSFETALESPQCIHSHTLSRFISQSGFIHSTLASPMDFLPLGGSLWLIVLIDMKNQPYLTLEWPISMPHCYSRSRAYWISNSWDSAARYIWINLIGENILESFQSNSSLGDICYLRCKGTKQGLAIFLILN